MEQYDPSDYGIDEVREYLAEADEAEKARVITAERHGKNRKTLLRENGIDPDERLDAAGRVLYPWEATPAKQVVVEVEESDEEREAREAQLAEDDATATVQPAGDPVGTGDPGPADTGISTGV